MRALRHGLCALPHKENGTVYWTTLARHLRLYWRESVQIRTEDVSLLADYGRGWLEGACVSTGGIIAREANYTVIRTTRKVEAHEVDLFTAMDDPG